MCKSAFGMKADFLASWDARKSVDAHSRERKVSHTTALGARVPQAELYVDGAGNETFIQTSDWRHYVTDKKFEFNA